MGCTRIKQYSCRGGVDKKRTQNNIRCFSSFFSRDMVQAASCYIGLILLSLPRESTALTLIGSRRAEARRGGFLQGALLREMPWLSTSIAATSLAVVGRVEDVAVSSRRISAGGAVA
jgi:hypothetical protein